MPIVRRRWTFTIVSIALFMGMLDNLVVTTALPSIGRALHADISNLEWTVNSYTLAFAVMIIPASIIGDRFGRRRALLWGVLLFTAGSVGSALFGSAGMLTAARAIQGIGAACIIPLTLTILANAYPPEKRAAAIGLWVGVSGLGLAAGPLVGGAIVSGWSWNAVFWVNVPVGILLLVLGRLHLEESHGEIRPIDFRGVALVGGGLIGIVYGLIRGNTIGWSSIEIMGSLLAGGVLLLAFIARERTAKDPAIDPGLFKSRSFSVSNAVGFLMSFGMFGSIFFIPLYVQNVLHYSALRSGLGTTPWTGTIMVVSPFAGILAGRIGPRFVVLTGMIAQVIALVWLARLVGSSVAYTSLLPAFILGGVGMGLTLAPLSSTIIMSAAEGRQGQASGTYNTVRELGGVFGIAVLGAVFQHIVTTPADFIDGFRTAVLAGAGVVSAGVVISVLLPSAGLGLAGKQAGQRSAPRDVALADTVVA